MQEVETPLLSGIPYMFRFTVREDNHGKTVGDDRKMMQWVVRRLRVPQPYMGLCSRYSQVLFNSATLACLCLVVLVTVFKEFMLSLLTSAKAYLYLSCSASSLTGSQYGAVYQYSEAIMEMLNQTYAQQIQQYEYTVNATLWNLQASTSQYTELLGAYYQTIESGLPGAAYQASRNVTQVLGDWAQEQLSGASSYTTTLLQKIHDALGELDSSSSSESATIKSNITTSVPTDINANLTQWHGISAPVFKNITSNAETQLESLFTNATATIANLFNQYSRGLPSNISLVGSAESGYQPDSCSTVISQFDGYARKLTKQYKVQILVLVLAAVLVMTASAVWTSCQWRQARELSSKLQCADANHPPPAMEILNEYNSPFLGLVHRLTDNRRYMAQATANNVRWLVSYVCSSTFLTMLAMGWCFIILSIAMSSLGSVLRKAHLQVDLAGNLSLPSQAVVNATVNSTTISVSTNDLNAQIEQLETNINDKIAGSLTDLVTTVNSIMTTINKTMAESVLDKLESVNLTLPPAASSLNFSLIYSSGFAIQQVTLGRLPAATLNSTTTNSQQSSYLLGGDYVYGLQNVTTSCANAEKTLRALGVSFISVWLAGVVGCTLYVFLIL